MLFRSLKKEEVEQLFLLAKKITKEQVPLIIGTGTNATESTIANTIDAQKLGAQAALVVVPYYNKPPQRGLFEHFTSVANAANIPIILYNVPGRTVTSLDLNTVVDLSKNQKIIGIKEASGNKNFAIELRKKCHKDFVLLSGDDATYVDFLEAGGDGVISVASHIIPQQMKQWHALHMQNKTSEAKLDLKKWLPLIDLLFVESNPIPVKKAAQILGLIELADMRSPLSELSKKHTAALINELKKQGLT